MSWLTCLEIDAGLAYQQRIFDSYAWHQRLWECFPNAPDHKRDFLTRIDELESTFRIWILSKRKPSIPSWCSADDFKVKAIKPSYLSQRYYAFDLRANPTKTIPQRDANGEILRGANGKRMHGRRVPLLKQEELRAWLVRKGEVRGHDPKSGRVIPGGFRLVGDRPLDISPVSEHYFRKKNLTGLHSGVQFRGVLEVTNRDSFAETYYAGLGSAKSFGFGLLLLAPVKI